MYLQNFEHGRPRGRVYIVTITTIGRLNKLRRHALPLSLSLSLSLFRPGQADRRMNYLFLSLIKFTFRTNNGRSIEGKETTDVSITHLKSCCCSYSCGSWSFCCRIKKTYNQIEEKGTIDMHASFDVIQTNNNTNTFLLSSSLLSSYYHRFKYVTVLMAAVVGVVLYSNSDVSTVTYFAVYSISSKI